MNNISNDEITNILDNSSINKELLLEEMYVHCDILDIDPVKVKFKTKLDGTVLAMYIPSSRTIYVKRDIKLGNALLMIAHEMRHVWQMDNGHFSDNYKMRNNTTLLPYNEQWEEIDANAYASLYLKTFYGFGPLFNTLNDTIKSRIKIREKEILKEFIKDEEGLGNWKEMILK